MVVQLHNLWFVPELELLILCVLTPGMCGFSLYFARGLISYIKLWKWVSECVCTWCPMMNWPSVQGVFPPHAHCSWDRLQSTMTLTRVKQLHKMNEERKKPFACRVSFYISYFSFPCLSIRFNYKSSRGSWKSIDDQTLPDCFSFWAQRHVSPLLGKKAITTKWQNF